MDRSYFKKLMDLSDKGTHHGYERFYYPIMNPFIEEPIRLLEIGVDSGKSMQIWKKMFKNANHIFGIGYKNHQRQYIDRKEENLTLFMGDQSDRTFLRKFVEDSGGDFDFIIDDGSHVPSHGIVSFEELWGSVKEGGYYIIEDIEVSYWKKSCSIYGYPLKNEGSIVDYFKNVAESVNNQFQRKPDIDIASVTFVKDMIIIRKIDQYHKPFFNHKPYWAMQNLP